MKRQWRVKRQTVAQLDGQRRWDRVYQMLLEWQETTQMPKLVKTKRQVAAEEKSDDQ